ncbi:MAG: hypothetical protein CMP25_01065 [Rickettsiales bacterium]|nr:hypothetical protein [Rickettsiales bacterium]|tara:strand:- start:223 stop:546 length:324 start_codon:yes stop_codon:yes gene_type:complete
MRIKFFLFLFIIFVLEKSNIRASDNWVGKWLALDQWQSEFSIILKKNGIARSNYGDGQKGFWKIIDGNVLIKWNSGKEDFIFRGVMGIQRLHKSTQSEYTSGMKKIN